MSYNDHANASGELVRLNILHKCRKRAAEEELLLRQIFDDVCRTSCVAQLEQQQARGCPICRTDISMILGLHVVVLLIVYGLYLKCFYHCVLHFSIYCNNADDYPNCMCLLTRFTSDSNVR